MELKSKIRIRFILFRALVILLTVAVAGLAAGLIGYILKKGLPYVSWEFLTTEPDILMDTYGIKPMIINTIYTVVLTLLFCIPLGIGSAIYLAEYAKQGKIVSAIRFAIEILAGIPSIVYGLFGMLFFVGYCKWDYSLLSGAMTLAIMVLPVIMRTTEEALMAVPKSFREGSFGLGAGKLRTVFVIVLPSTVPGILSGIILATGRIVGETAALIYTAGTMAKIPSNIFSSARTLSVHMYRLSNEGLHTDAAFATAVVLLLMVIGINALSNVLAGKFARNKGEKNHEQI